MADLLGFSLIAIPTLFTIASIYMVVKVAQEE